MNNQIIISTENLLSRPPRNMYTQVLFYTCVVMRYIILQYLCPVIFARQILKKSVDPSNEQKVPVLGISIFSMKLQKYFQLNCMDHSNFLCLSPIGPQFIQLIVQGLLSLAYCNDLLIVKSPRTSILRYLLQSPIQQGVCQVRENSENLLCLCISKSKKKYYYFVDF